MDEVNEATILHNLRCRFQNGDIYTNIGRILVSINPFDWETSEVFFNSEWVSTFQFSDPDDPVTYVVDPCRVGDSAAQALIYSHSRVAPFTAPTVSPPLVFMFTTARHTCSASPPLRTRRS